MGATQYEGGNMKENVLMLMAIFCTTSVVSPAGYRFSSNRRSTMPDKTSDLRTLGHGTSDRSRNSYGSAYSSKSHGFSATQNLDNDGFATPAEITVGPSLATQQVSRLVRRRCRYRRQSHLLHQEIGVSRLKCYNRHDLRA